MNQLAVSAPCVYGIDTERRFELPACFKQRIENGLNVTFSYYKVNENLEVERITQANIYDEDSDVMKTKFSTCLYNISSTPGMLWLFGGEDFTPLSEREYESITKILVP